jgi:flagellar hook protein FlgE
MTQALFTGVTGLLAHQAKLDIVANNLANMNTVGFKAQRILFADLMYSSIRPAASGDLTVSGTNPIQKGIGVQVAMTSRNYSQGVLSSTGQSFDFAIEGEGFFVVNNGENRYTRAGSFALDGNGYLIDPSTGGYVQRIGSAGEGDEGNVAFQTRGNSAIQIPLGIGIIGKATSSTRIKGNLPATATPPAVEILSTAQPFEVGNNPATLSTLLNDLEANTVPYVSGDQINLSGSTFSGTPINATLNVDENTTVGDLINFINSNISGAVASLNAQGNLRIIADQPGPSNQHIELVDASANTGGTRFNQHQLVEEVKGKNADTVQTTLQVYDERGTVHSLNVLLEKISANRWDATVTVNNGTGEVIDGIVKRIEFNENGTFKGVFGTGAESDTIEIHFAQMSTPQRIKLDFSPLTHFANRFTSSTEQDGFPPGNLANISVSNTGFLEGIGSNGRRIPIAQLAVATFSNVGGLEAIGQNFFRETVNSGSARMEVGVGNNSAIRSGQLETSNVDVAYEFMQLIVAQRGYSANARTISVANEVMQELTSILR